MIDLVLEKPCLGLSVASRRPKRAGVPILAAVVGNWCAGMYKIVVQYCYVIVIHVFVDDRGRYP